MDTCSNYQYIMNILAETSVIAFNRIFALAELLVMLTSTLFLGVSYLLICSANYMRHIRFNFKSMNIQDGVEEYISYYTDTIQLYIEQSNIISLLQKYNDDMKHGNIYNEVDVNDKLDVIDEGDEDEDEDEDEGECGDKNDEGECGDKNDEGDDRYVFKCYHCKKLIVQDSEEHDRCITDGDGDDWFCGDCHEFCPCDEDDGDNERNNDERDEKVYINYNLPNNIVQEYIKDTEKSYDNKPSLRYRKIYKKEVFEQEEEEEEEVDEPSADEEEDEEPSADEEEVDESSADEEEDEEPSADEEEDEALKEDPEAEGSDSDESSFDDTQILEALKSNKLPEDSLLGKLLSKSDDEKEEEDVDTEEEDGDAEQKYKQKLEKLVAFAYSFGAEDVDIVKLLKAMEDEDKEEDKEDGDAEQKYKQKLEKLVAFAYSFGAEDVDVVNLLKGMKDEEDEEEEEDEEKEKE